MPKEFKRTNFKIHLDEYNKFENFIIEMIRNHISFDFSYNYSIKKLISPRGKIPYDKFSEFERILNSRIMSGEIDWIEIIQNENSSESNQNTNETFYKIKKAP